MTREKIQEIALARKVPFLVHFTRAQNVPSILKHGLLPRSFAQKIGLDPVINDAERLDGRLDGTSVSIAFPNGSMFYRLRNANPDIDWVILAISPSVLWSKKVLFCKHNAADSRISQVSSEDLSRAEAFEDMFAEIEGHESRSDQGLKACDPTDVQGEVLVMEPIEPEFILGALFNTDAARDAYQIDFGRRKLIVHKGRKGLFANRTYYRKFGGG
ncbi:DarT ssDNA thymidine ADP-ribosyltransferase family protein [Sphingomonas sp. MS122]|uniref:DarT ssDNA thymidine ADP-ribosyltransferase family protein n=1 Tax=Sphingomonas sp. MS122 TaxID=3412683 RepID=UPI003C2B38A0